MASLCPVHPDDNWFHSIKASSTNLSRSTSAHVCLSRSSPIYESRVVLDGIRLAVDGMSGISLGATVEIKGRGVRMPEPDCIIGHWVSRNNSLNQISRRTS